MTLLLIIAVCVYVLVGLLVAALVESEYKPMSDFALWSVILLWPLVVAGILALYILTLAVVIVTMIVAVVQTTIQTIASRKETK